MNKHIFAISADAPAIPLNPKNPAISAITIKVIVHNNMYCVLKD